MMVMMMAITPSLNASSRFFPMLNVLAIKSLAAGHRHLLMGLAKLPCCAGNASTHGWPSVVPNVMGKSFRSPAPLQKPIQLNQLPCPRGHSIRPSTPIRAEECRIRQRSPVRRGSPSLVAVRDPRSGLLQDVPAHGNGIERSLSLD